MPGQCNCEHGEHFDNGPGHEYLAVPSGERTARYVGRVCDKCAQTHMADYLEPVDIPADTDR